jgi:hypothetical protein
VTPSAADRAPRIATPALRDDAQDDGGRWPVKRSNEYRLTLDEFLLDFFSNPEILVGTSSR